MAGPGYQVFKRQQLMTWTLLEQQSSMKPEVKTKADVIDSREHVASVYLPEEGSAVVRILKDAMYSTCALQNSDLQELEDLHKL